MSAAGWLAVDGGQSAIRVLHGASGRVATGPGVRHVPGGVAAGTIASLAYALEQLGQIGPIDRAVLGLSGLPRSHAGLDAIERAVRQLTGARDVWLCGDDATAHAGATGALPGVVAAVGTGSAVIGVSPEGRLHTVDGRGYLFGDDGSSFGIGRDGVAAALAAYDGRGEPTSLIQLAERRWGPIDQVTEVLYAGDAVVEEVARFAVDVLAAAHAGDEPARAILAARMSQLAISIRAAARGFGHAPVPVHVVGGLVRGLEVLRPYLTVALERELPAAVLEPARGTPLDGAALLARTGTAGPYASALRRGSPLGDQPVAVVQDSTDEKDR